MKRKNFTSGMLLSAAILLMSVSCEKETAGVWPDGRPSYDDGILEEVAVFLSDVVSDSEVLDEVHSAVTESYECGYDEEYLFSNVVNCPGRGTGFRSVKAEGGYGEGALFRSLVSTLDGRTGFPGVIPFRGKMGGGHDDDLGFGILFEHGRIQHMQRTVKGIHLRIIGRSNRGIPMTVIVCTAQNTDDFCLLLHLLRALIEIMVKEGKLARMRLPRDTSAADSVADRFHSGAFAKHIPIGFLNR